MRNAFMLIVGLVFTLLGGLWLLQGLGAVQIKPILCFANCAPVQGPSAIWAIIGTIIGAVGIFALVNVIKRYRRS